MKLYILDNKNIAKYDLPVKIDEFYSIDYILPNSDERCLITFEPKDGKWLLKSNGILNILGEGYTLESALLEVYDEYHLKALGQDELIKLFVLPDNNDLIYQLDLASVQEITFGSKFGCNICYQKNTISEHAFTIKRENTEWYLYLINSTKDYIYIDRERCIGEKFKLGIGSTIFVDGFKIVWMHKFMIINNPNNLISVSGLQPYTNVSIMDNTNTNPVSDEEQSVTAYKESDYFFHTPRIQEFVVEEKITIDPPPQTFLKEEMPWLLSVGSSITMAASSMVMGYNVTYSIIGGKRPMAQLIPQIVMCAAMIIGSLIMPRIIASYQKKKDKENEAKRLKKYNEYLDNKEKEIDLTLKKQAQIMYDNSVSSAACKNVLLSRNNRYFWCREINDDDFLELRLGIGSIDAPIEIQAPREQFTLEEDGLLERVYGIVEKYKKLENVPLNVSLAKNHISSFIYYDDVCDKYMDNMLLQLVTLHSADDLKIIIFTNEMNAKRWDFAKYLPHCWSEDFQTRYFATTMDDIKNISSTLSETFKERKGLVEGDKNVSSTKKIKVEKEYKNFDPYYLIIYDNYKNTDEIGIIDNILKNKDYNYGFGLAIVTRTMKNLPVQCDTFIQIGSKEGCVLGRNISVQNQQKFTVEYESDIDMREVSNKIMNIPLVPKAGLKVLPSSLSFLEMYGVSKIEQLNIINKWKTNNPVISLSAPIGVQASGEQFKLNLHEKNHGPHGLIAGSTGSGKSEFIITYILSMCVNYHPYEVQFVLIDYKGGGLAGAFENKETKVRIPHLVGTITNLDTSEMNRTLVSIESELKRRQRVFNETKDALGESTIDIYKYQRLYREGLVKEPMAHLFIVSDEFAELKSQQPEFMDQLISTARIGRSLGVHLILATQKPSGVVNDQIWSNTKFRVCLKVQDRADSMEMLKRPEAASIKEAGRFYLQVGYDDLFDKGQSGWAGARYQPTDRVIKKEDDSLNIINNVGYTTKTIKDLIVTKTNNTDYGDQLTNIVKTIHNIGVKEKLVTRKLWLDSIPEIIYVENLKKKYSYKPTPYFINPVIGEYDKPSAQEQGLLNLNLTDGNTVIWGQPKAGKENLLSTIIWSSSIEHTPQEINFYIIDCGSEALKIFNNMPHVGSVATIEEQEKVYNTFVMIDEELQRRKDLMVDYGGSYREYIANSGQKLPLIVTIINSYELFVESYNRLADGIQTLYRDGNKYGIIFIITSISTSTIKQRMLQNFSNKLALQIPNETEYRSLVNAPRGLFPAKLFGRGLVATDSTALEFQTAMFCAKKDISIVVKKSAEQLLNAYKYKAKPIPVVPDVVNFNLLAKDFTDITKVPLGIEIESKESYIHDFTSNKVNTILATQFKGEKVSFLKTLIDGLKMIPNIKFSILDLSQVFSGVYEDETYYDKDFDNVLIKLNNDIMTNKNNNEIKNIVMVIGAGLLKSKLSVNSKKVINNLFTNLDTITNTHFIFIDGYSSFRQLQTEFWYQDCIDNTSGIWLGEEVGNQTAININDLALEDRKKSFPYMAYAIHKGKYIIFKHIVEDEVE